LKESQDEHIQRHLHATTAHEAECIIACMSDITKILISIEAGERQATAELLPLVYDELRRLAAQRLMQ